MLGSGTYTTKSEGDLEIMNSKSSLLTIMGMWVTTIIFLLALLIPMQNGVAEIRERVASLETKVDSVEIRLSRLESKLVDGVQAP